MGNLFASVTVPLLVAGCCASPMFSQTAAPPPPLTAEEIMARVAVNQDRSDAERSHFVYLQHARVQSRKGNTLMCEEITDTRITPTEKGNQRSLLTLTGHVRSGKRVIRYTVLPGTSPSTPRDGDSSAGDEKNGDTETVLDADAGNAPVKVNDMDLDLVESMRRQFTSDKASRDGLAKGLFPLTTNQQKDLTFALKGKESKNGRDTYHVLFQPRDRNNYGWKGEAWIDTTSFEPVVVRTALSRSLPLGVRTLLGTNVPGLGFTAIYAPQGENVWFPASFGTEFKIKVLFLFQREVIVSVENREFERTHVSTTLHTGEGQPVTSPE